MTEKMKAQGAAQNAMVVIEEKVEQPVEAEAQAALAENTDGS